MRKKGILLAYISLEVRMRNRRGFTLAELMVVIGIIVVLMAILLPALRNARESARSTQCANNERNIWSAMEAYSVQYDGVLPAAPNGDKWSLRADTRLAYFFDAKLPHNLEFDHGAIMKYLGSQPQRRATMRCPNAADQTPNYSYPLNAELNVADGYIRLFQIVRPEHKIIVFEDDNDNKVNFDGHFTLGGSDGDKPSRHHFHTSTTGRGNYCFADGHVESFFPNELTQSQKVIDSYAALLK